MTRVRLEIDEVQIHRPKKRWKLYFLVVTDHPTEYPFFCARPHRQ